MGTVETYKSTTPRIVSGQSVPAQHPWQDRDLRDFREREREREPHRPQISDFGCSEFWNVFGAKTKRHNSEFNASLITQIRCTLSVHVFIVSGLVSIVNDAPVRRWRVATFSSFWMYCVTRCYSTIHLQWQTYTFDHRRASIQTCVAWFSTLPGMKCQNHKAIGFLKGNTLLWFSWECRNHHDRAPLHAQNPKFAKPMGKVTRKFCGLKKSEQVSAVTLVWVTFCRYNT